MRRQHLVRLLTAHRPGDALEAEHRAALLRLSEAPGEPFARDHFVPGHFTASAFVLSPDERDLLLILHAKLGLWLQPGGHVDPDDVDILAAARREVAEETGITDLHPLPGFPALVDVDVHTIPARKGDPTHQHFDVRVLWRAGTRDLAAGSDALSARWVPLTDVADAGSDDSVLRAVRKIRAWGCR